MSVRSHLHELKKSVIHPDYDVCMTCGTHIRRGMINPELLYGHNYWDGKKHSSFGDQLLNHLKLDTKLRTKAESITTYIQPFANGRALEIGCSPGALLQKLCELLPKVYGLDYTNEYLHKIKEVAPNVSGLFFGDFPKVTAGIADSAFNYVIAMDVWEHALDYRAFFHECFRLCRTHGKIIMMLPIQFEGERVEDRHFMQEHNFLPTQKYLETFHADYPIKKPRFDRWLPGHEIVVWKKW